ncbi:DUF1189 family protein [Myxococcota bacterium]|nr:DUF1189 family protein [Myxococcota bacterium]
MAHDTPPMKAPSLYAALLLFPLLNGGYWRGVARWGSGFGIVYLHVMLLIVWVPLTVQGLRLIDRVQHEYAPKVLNDFPEIVIHGGRARVRGVEEPWVMADPQTDLPFLVIDTTGQVTSLKGRAESALLTKTELIVTHLDPLPTQVIPLTVVDAFFLNRGLLEELLAEMSGFVRWAFFPMAFTLSISYRAGFWVGFGLFGYLYSRRGGAEGLSWGACARFGALALTPIMAVDTVFTLAHWTPPLWELLSFGAGGALTAWAVRQSLPRTP